MNSSPYQLFNPEQIPLSSKAHFETNLLKAAQECRRSQIYYFRERNKTALIVAREHETRLKTQIDRIARDRSRIEKRGDASVWFFELFELCRQMLQLQRRYFKHRNQTDLISSRMTEEKVDKLINEISA